MIPVTTLAVVLAGGLGTRLRSVVSDVPKPMAPVSGKPFLEHLLNYWITQGIRRFILSVGYQKDAIIRHFGSRYSSATIDYAEESEPLGTGGGLLNAMAAIQADRPTLVLNGDTFFRVPFRELLTYHEQNESEWTMTLFRTSERARYLSIDVNSRGRITTLDSQPNAISWLANGGVYLVQPSATRELHIAAGKVVSLENAILPRLLEMEARLYGFECVQPFLDIGIPDDYYRASQIIGAQ